MINLGDASGVLTGVIAYVGMVLAALWLAMILWVYRDMRARSRDRAAQLVVALMVAVLTLPGLLIYLFLRPRETLSEAYERSLEEEALLQEIEEKPVCPGCKQRVRETWQACPNCHTRLKKPCPRCAQMLELSWDLCPYCATALPSATNERVAAPAFAHARPAGAADQWTAPSRSSRRGEALEFLESDEG